MEISTHTLRGERDVTEVFAIIKIQSFQLTRSVGSVTINFHIEELVSKISTHTLRGERDYSRKNNIKTD